MEYWEMDFKKVNEFNFLNEVEEFISRWSQSLLDLRSSSNLKQKALNYSLWGVNILYFQFFIRAWWFVVSVS